MTFKVFADPRSSGAPLPHYHNPDGGEDITAVLLALFWFRGTATRLVYWLVNLGVSFCGFLIVMTYLSLYGLEGARPYLEPTSPVMLVYSVLGGWIMTTTMVRRLNDRGWPTWLIVAYFLSLPILPLIAFFTVPEVLLLSLPLYVWAAIECAFLGSKVD